MMNKDIPKENERKSGVRPRKPTIVIATEGEKTEPDYFTYLERDYREINIIVVPAENGHSQPRQVLDSVLCKRQELAKERLSSDQYWIVIDHDHRPRPELEKVMQDAEANQISVADSNPCFEAWLLQHFSSLTEIVQLSHVNQVKSCNHVIENHLKQFDPKYKKGSLDSTIYMPKVSSAIQNAEFDEATASDLDDFTYTGSRVQMLVKEILTDD